MSNINNTSMALESRCPDTGGSPISYSRGEGVAILLPLIILMVLTVIGNAIVIVAVVRFRHLQVRTNHFVVSLAVADILVAVLVMPFGAYNQFNNLAWDLGKTMCLASICMDVMMTTTSILHLSCLAMDRYFAICNPFFYHERITKKTVYVLLVLCWTVPILISWLPIMNEWNALGIERQIRCRTPPDGRACVFLVNIPFAVLCSSIAFYTPMIFMFVVNLRIFKEARRQAMHIRKLEVSTSKGHKSMRAETKAAKTISIIMGAFCLCWCPFFIINVLDPFMGYGINYFVWMIATWLGYINSTLNPFLYYFFNRAFRRAFNKILTCHRFGYGRAKDETVISSVNYANSDNSDDMIRMHTNHRH